MFFPLILFRSAPTNKKCWQPLSNSAALGQEGKGDFYAPWDHDSRSW